MLHYVLAVTDADLVRFRLHIKVVLQRFPFKATYIVDIRLSVLDGVVQNDTVRIDGRLPVEHVDAGVTVLAIACVAAHIATVARLHARGDRLVRDVIFLLLNVYKCACKISTQTNECAKCAP